MYQVQEKKLEFNDYEDNPDRDEDKDLIAYRYNVPYVLSEEDTFVGYGHISSENGKALEEVEVLVYHYSGECVLKTSFGYLVDSVVADTNEYKYDLNRLDSIVFFHPLNHGKNQKILKNNSCLCQQVAVLL